LSHSAVLFSAADRRRKTPNFGSRVSMKSSEHEKILNTKVHSQNDIILNKSGAFQAQKVLWNIPLL